MMGYDPYAAAYYQQQQQQLPPPPYDYGLAPPAGGFYAAPQYPTHQQPPVHQQPAQGQGVNLVRLLSTRDSIRVR
jgi:hypothetical protein